MRTSVTIAMAATACATVGSSALRTGPLLEPATAPVALSATRDPEGAEELGIVEAHGRCGVATIPEIVAEFRTRVASLGGDHGRIDTFGTRYDLERESYTYECGATETRQETRTVSTVAPDGTVSWTTETVPVAEYVSRTCTGWREVEVGTFTMTGRAFRLRKEEP
jgi:hypothetical protein